MVRSRVFLLKDVGRKVKVYNGKNFSDVLVTEAMLGHCYGFYCLTKTIGRGIHIKKKDRKSKKK